MFKIDKNDILDKFKDFLDKNSTKEEGETRITSAEEKPSSKLDILYRVLEIYNFVFQNCLMKLRHAYIYDDNEFNRVKNGLQNYIKNKIRSTIDGRLYIKIGTLVALSGDRDEYEDWVLGDKRKVYSIVKAIVDELNDYLSGSPIEEKNKSIIFDMNEEAYVELFFNILPEKTITSLVDGDVQDFETILEQFAIKNNLPRSTWEGLVTKAKEVFSKQSSDTE
jgi:hypothetical protein